jgi:hypothetical protein
METNGKTQALQLAVAPNVLVKANIGIPEWWPSGHRAGVVLAHDVGSDMNQHLLVQLQERLTSQGFLNIRFNFPHAELGKKRPDALPTLERTYRVAAQALLHNPEEAPAMLIFAGSGLGAKVASHAIAGGMKADGLICISYPLHPAGKPNQSKPDALFRVICPILFVQGSRDANCRVDRLELLRRRIGAPTQVKVIEDADHSLAPVKRSNRTPEDVIAEVLSSIESYLERTVGS